MSFSNRLPLNSVLVSILWAATVFWATGSVCAFDGTAFFAVNDIETYNGCGVDGLWKVDISTGQSMQLFGSNSGNAIITFATLSWDGRRLCFGISGKCYIVDNDGENLTRIDNMTIPEYNIAWTRQGLFYAYNNKDWWHPEISEESWLYRYDLETKSEEIIYKQNGKGRYVGWRPVFGSATGEVFSTRLYMPSSCGSSTNPDHDGKTYLQYSKDGHLLKAFGWRDWGHGDDLTMCGRNMCHQIFSSHNGFWMRQTSDGQSTRSFIYGPVTAMKSNRWDHHEVYPCRCGNNPDYMLFKILARWNQNFSADQRIGMYRVYNFATDEFAANVPNPIDGTDNLQCGPVSASYGGTIPHPVGLWVGELPSASDASAILTPLDNKVAFGVGGATETVTKSVEIVCLGDNTPGVLSATVAPGADWLSTRMFRFRRKRNSGFCDLDSELLAL